ncbi:MAG: metalloprotease PmbA, partial [Candidatus Competibacteraceae bacterium]|nr:metalloprotease PmbA [Candidatus Competibacteraceae bacterium]
MSDILHPDASSIRPLPEISRLESLVGDILAEARSQGANAAEAAVSFANALGVTVRLGEVETLEQQRDRSLGVTVYFGQRKGTASTSDWRADAVRETVAAACAIARQTAEDPCAGLADAQRLAREVPDLGLYHPWNIEAPEAIELARECEAVAREYDSRVTNSEGASVDTRTGLTVYSNSHGFLGGYRSSRHSLSCSLIARDDRGMQRDHWYTLDRDAERLEAPRSVGEQAARRTLGRLEAKRLSTRQCPVLFIPEMARGIVAHFLGAIRGGALYRRSSFLVDSLGRQVFPDFLQMEERPHIPGALGSAPFDAEGVATEDRELVQGGVIKSYILDSYSARRLGMATTGNAGGVHNLIVQPTGQDWETMLRTLDRGLVVTHLMGQGVNLLTGDYSRGAAGFWVEGGEIQYPV